MSENTGAHAGAGPGSGSGRTYQTIRGHRCPHIIMQDKGQAGFGKDRGQVGQTTGTCRRAMMTMSMGAQTMFSTAGIMISIRGIMIDNSMGRRPLWHTGRRIHSRRKEEGRQDNACRRHQPQPCRSGPGHAASILVEFLLDNLLHSTLWRPKWSPRHSMQGRPWLAVASSRLTARTGADRSRTYPTGALTRAYTQVRN